ncbi:MAG: class II glutamine amidotransferase [Pirellulales bacterium]|nr:class II glutamine amidotransferase [Pirellulales bacterium]
MCRFFGFRATEPTEISCSLVKSPHALLAQSRVDRRGETHPDGWGVGYYAGATPEIIRSPAPAYDDAQYLAAAERICSPTVLAHVRQASVGGASLENTHPFTYGRWVFAHNGTARPFDEVEPLLVAETDPRYASLRLGTTDSEAIFVWLLSRMLRAGLDPASPATDVPRTVQLVADATRQLASWCAEAPPENAARLNLMLTDGDLLIVTRWNHTLSWLQRDGVRDAEACGAAPARRTGDDYRAVIVASEPLTDEAWQEVPDRSIVWIDGDVRAELQPL